MNNFKVHSLTSVDLDEYFGFTDWEVREMLHYYGQDEHYEAVKEWYDGYRFGNVDIYCPWNVICYCEEHRNNRNAEPKNYWLNTSGNEALNQIKEKNYAENMRLDGVHTILKYGITCNKKKCCVLFEKRLRGKRMENVISIQNLSKSFGDVKAVDDLSFRVKRGELFAFLGVNGAGKSTTISIICGQLKKDSGSVRIHEMDVERKGEETKRLLGVVFQDSVLDRPLTVKENLKSRAALYGIMGKAFEKRLGELVELLDFREFLNRPVGKLSGGQRRRIDIARALLHKPELLILDEPTTGLDPQTRKLIWDVIEKIRLTENMTVFLTTHYMEEAASAGYVIILDKGKIAAEGTPYELKNRYVQDYISLYGVSEEEVRSLKKDYTPIREGYQIKVSNTAEATELIVDHQGLFRDYEVVKGGMDDVFLAVTGKALGGEKA